MNKYDELMLIEDIKQTLISDENYRIKIACIESYFNVYERMKKKHKQKSSYQHNSIK